MINEKSKPVLYGMEENELSSFLTAAGFKAYRAKQALEWIYKKHIRTWEEAKNLPKDLLQFLKENALLHVLEFENEKESFDHESQKFLFKTHDGRFLESVLIIQKGRRTVCVSTQLGCKIGCTFCASGKGKFGRNLTAGEIVEQVAWIERKMGQPVTNIVYMGMGEPLDNFDQTMKSLRIFQAGWGFELGARRITVSTSGLTPKIVEFVHRNEGRVRLSISLHSSIEEKRNELVPINRKYSLKELVKTLREMDPILSRRITFEYTLIKGENDSPKEAAGVVRIAKPLDALVNIIPYNPIHEMLYETPSQERIKAFRSYLVEHGVRVIVRQTAGRDIDAACGQLRLDREQTV